MNKSDAQHAASHDFKRLIVVRKIGDSGLMQSVRANVEECATVATFLSVQAVHDLNGEMKIQRWRSRGLMIEGKIYARVSQMCVVTLEPVEEKIEAEFERRYLPSDMIGPASEHVEVFVDPEGEDPPEPLANEIDVGEVLVEELVLNLNPYPRKEGILFAASPVEPVAAKENPFAALAKLKRKLEKKP